MVFEALQNKERKRNTLVSKSFTFYYSILCFPFVISRLHSLLLLLCGGTDDGTENKISTQGGDRILSLSRRDYSVTTGVGVNFVATKRLQAYIQALGGVGRVEGYTSDYISEKVGFERNDLNRTSYLLSAGIGIDLSISKNWKIGAGYSFRYLGDVDGSHAIFARISYVIP